MMQTITTISKLRAWRKTAGTIVFVPTMGNIHAGHLALVQAAKKYAQKVVVSIFVNHLQFGQGEDFAAYPRTFAEDCAKLEAAGVAVLFAPHEQELYPNIKQNYQIEPPAYLQNELCGAFRPGHFRGVATVVSKLFNIVQPDFACFGKKDYQQLQVIYAMVVDLNFSVQIIPVDTGRDQDGLALSSRNGYLTASERQEAPRLYQVLQAIKEAIWAGCYDYAVLEGVAVNELRAHGWQVDYVEVRDAKSLQCAHKEDRHVVLLGAARLGKVRLIDNIEIEI